MRVRSTTASISIVIGVRERRRDPMNDVIANWIDSDYSDDVITDFAKNYLQLSAEEQESVTNNIIESCERLDDRYLRKAMEKLESELLTSESAEMNRLADRLIAMIRNRLARPFIENTRRRPESVITSWINSGYHDEVISVFAEYFNKLSVKDKDRVTRQLKDTCSQRTLKAELPQILSMCKSIMIEGQEYEYLPIALGEHIAGILNQNPQLMDQHERAVRREANLRIKREQLASSRKGNYSPRLMEIYNAPPARRDRVEGNPSAPVLHLQDPAVEEAQEQKKEGRFQAFINRFKRK